MARINGRIIKPETLFIDHVAFDMEELGGTVQGTLEVPVGAALTVGETYRIELNDGRSGEIRIKSYNEISTVGEFEVLGDLVT